MTSYDLRCTYCAGILGIEVEDRGDYYSDIHPESIWCDDCFAVWNVNGTLRTPGIDHRREEEA